VKELGAVSTHDGNRKNWAHSGDESSHVTISTRSMSEETAFFKKRTGCCLLGLDISQYAKMEESDVPPLGMRDTCIFFRTCAALPASIHTGGFHCSDDMRPKDTEDRVIA